MSYESFAGDQLYHRQLQPQDSCEDCSPECCTDLPCPSPMSLTSQCTDQCVVIACRDPAHADMSCNANEAHSRPSCDMVCDRSTDCEDCNGFDAFLQCCTDLHTNATPTHSDPSNFSWDPQLEAFFCSCSEEQAAQISASSSSLSSDFGTPSFFGHHPTTQSIPSTQSSPLLLPGNYHLASDGQSINSDSGLQHQSSMGRNTSQVLGMPSNVKSSPSDPGHIPHSQSLSCMWGSCSATLSSLEELVGHVNIQHLRRSAIPTPDPRPKEIKGNLESLSCLWRDCNEYHSPSMIPSTSTSSHDDTLDLLASHLLVDHLGLVAPSRLSMEIPQLQGSRSSTPQGEEATIVTDETEVSKLTPPPEHECSGLHTCHWRNCGETFDTCDALTAHLTAQHVGSGKAQYECFWGGCGRNGSQGFTSKQKICRHLQSHTGHRPFQCKLCKQNFSEAATLQQHMRRHTQEKPYLCDFPGCGKSFAITGALTIHKRIHNGHKPFKCTYCDRAFAESSNLSKHLRTHTGARPYPCSEPGCGKSFARPDQLTRHGSVHRKREAKAGQGVKGEKMGV